MTPEEMVTLELLLEELEKHLDNNGGPSMDQDEILVRICHRIAVEHGTEDI
jgi:hypothetical protein